MLVFSEGHRGIVDAKALLVERVYGDKNGKYAIMARGEGLGEISGAVIMAQFPDEKTAIDALERAFQAFEDGEKCYRF